MNECLKINFFFFFFNFNFKRYFYLKKKNQYLSLLIKNNITITDKIICNKEHKRKILINYI